MPFLMYIFVKRVCYNLNKNGGSTLNNNKKALIRQAKIRDMLFKKDVVTLKEFCDTLNASVATIRNDLTYLEKQGVLKRVLGGAVSIEGTPTNTKYSTRINLYKDVKMDIVKYAVDHYVKEGMCIGLDAGSTCHYVAQYILEKDIECTIVTNAFNVINLLSKSDKIKLFCAGGYLDKEHNSYHDETALKSLEGMKTDLYFLSPNGISEEFAITSTAEDENPVKKLMMENAKKTYVLADHSKFERKAEVPLAGFDEIEKIICDDYPKTKISKRKLIKVEKPQ